MFQGFKIHNFKLVIILVVVIFFGVFAFAVFRYFIFSKDNPYQSINGVEKFSNLDDYVRSKKDFLDPEQAKKIQFERKDINLPLQSKIPQLRITMVPQTMGAGDLIYEPIAESQKIFFPLSKENLKNIFKINSPQDAVKYLNFALITIGKSSYDRASIPVYANEDYDTIGCQANPQNPPNPLPVNKIITQSTQTQDGFEIDWVYYNPTVPAGYWRDKYLITNEGDIVLKEKSEKPFWSCGEGVLF